MTLASFGDGWCAISSIQSGENIPNWRHGTTSFVECEPSALCLRRDSCDSFLSSVRLLYSCPAARAVLTPRNRPQEPAAACPYARQPIMLKSAYDQTTGSVIGESHSRSAP